MKKKIGVFVVICILTISVYRSGIIKNNSRGLDNSKEISTVNENADNVKSSLGVKIDDNTTDITSVCNSKEGNIKFLKSIEKDKILIASDMSISSDIDKKINIKIFNLSQGKVEKQLDIKLENPHCDFIPLNKGFYIVDKNLLESNGRVIYHVYDNELNFIRTLDLSNLKNKFNGEPKLSNNGDKLAYINSSNGKGQSIYTCDLDFKNEQKVYGVEYYTPNKLSTFDSIAFVDSDEKIAFTGMIYINEDTWPEAFGTVNINGKEFNYKEHDGINNIIQISKGKTFFSDANTAYNEDSSGQVFLEDNDSNNVQEYILKDKNESQRAYISDRGNFIITILSGKSKENEPIYRLRIYDTKSKKIIKEIDSTFKGKDFQKCYIRGMSIFEESNSIYIAYKLDKETKIYQYKLN